MSDNEWEMCYPFTNESKDFADGVAFGRIAYMMEAGMRDIRTDDLPIPATIGEQVRIAAEYYGYQCDLSPCIVDGVLMPDWINANIDTEASE